MPKKDEGLASYRAWLSENKKLEKMGLYGTDHYIKRVEQLEEKVKKLEAKLKRVDDKIKATSYVLAVTLQNLQPDMGSYINKRIYNNQANLVGVPNDEFFDKINILEQQQIYKDANLNAYASNDPIAVRARLLTEIETKKLQLRAEIAALRSN